MALSDHLTDDKMDAAFSYLVDTDDQIARAKANMEKTKRAAQRLESLVILSEEGPAHLRKAAAESSSLVKARWDEYHDAVYQYEYLKEKRGTEERRIEVWRTWYSAKKQGVNV